MSLLDNLPHKCSIFRVGRSKESAGGKLYGPILEQSDVECWEQAASSNEIRDFEKRGMGVSTKIFFVDNPGVTERHRILITERMGVASPNLDITDVSNPDVFDVVTDSYPDASAGLSILWRVMCDKKTGATQ